MLVTEAKSTRDTTQTTGPDLRPYRSLEASGWIRGGGSDSTLKNEENKITTTAFHVQTLPMRASGGEGREEGRNFLFAAPLSLSLVVVAPCCPALLLSTKNECVSTYIHVDTEPLLSEDEKN